MTPAMAFPTPGMDVSSPAAMNLFQWTCESTQAVGSCSVGSSTKGITTLQLYALPDFTEKIDDFNRL